MAAIELLTKGDFHPFMDEIKKINLRLETLMGLNGNIVYTNESLGDMLGVCTRTLQKYRNDRLIYYSKVDRHIWYRREDVEYFLLTTSNAPYQQGTKKKLF
jgi:hypothetical protein